MKKSVKYGIAFVAFAALAYALLKSQEGYTEADKTKIKKVIKNAKAQAKKNIK